MFEPDAAAAQGAPLGHGVLASQVWQVPPGLVTGVQVPGSGAQAMVVEPEPEIWAQA
jgi:hypothetical protein